MYKRQVQGSVTVQLGPYSPGAFLPPISPAGAATASDPVAPPFSCRTQPHLPHRGPNHPRQALSCLWHIHWGWPAGHLLGLSLIHIYNFLLHFYPSFCTSTVTMPLISFSVSTVIWFISPGLTRNSFCWAMICSPQRATNVTSGSGWRTLK